MYLLDDLHSANLDKDVGCEDILYQNQLADPEVLALYNQMMEGATRSILLRIKFIGFS